MNRRLRTCSSGAEFKTYQAHASALARFAAIEATSLETSLSEYFIRAQPRFSSRGAGRLRKGRRTGLEPQRAVFTSFLAVAKVSISAGVLSMRMRAILGNRIANPLEWRSLV